MESNPKEERLFLPQDLIYDIENDSFDSTEEISRIIKIASKTIPPKNLSS